MTTRRSAELFPPGEFLREELEARGWTQTDLAEILGRPLAMVNEVITGKRRITPETAKGLAAALGTSPELWLNLEAAYQLWRVRTDDSESVARRGRMFSLAPIKEMQRRGWLLEAGNPEILERQLLEFFRIGSLDEEPRSLAHAARKSSPHESLTPAQRAWLFRVEQLARSLDVAPFSQKKVERALTELRGVMQTTQSVRDIPRILGDAGIRFVIVEALSGTKIDGACFWIDDSPVVAMSIRFDRIDNFWFVLMHELGHVCHRDGALDTEMERIHSDTERPKCEQLADEFASSRLVPQEQLEEFVSRVRPRYSARAVEEFARAIRVHPGIVVGQLQHRGEVPWKALRQLLAPIRDYIIGAAPTDGWGVAA